MTKMTINEAFVLLKALRGRLAELSRLRTDCARSETYYGDTRKIIEPKYDVVDLDCKCIQLENAVLDLDTKIKQSNALTVIEAGVDKGALLAPLAHKR